MPATGEDLFPEIIALIVSCATREPMYNQEKENKRQYSAMSRVCRFWAKSCRFFVFEKITLHSAQDVRELRILLEATPPAGLQPVCNLTKNVTAVVKGLNIPWLHAISSDILPMLAQYHDNAEFEYRVVWQPAASARLGTPLHPSLPRSLPSLHTPVTSLLLHNASFVNAEQLGKVLRGLIHLRSLSLMNITLKRLPDQQSFVRTRFGSELATLRTSSLIVTLPAPWFIPALLASCAQYESRSQTVRSIRKRKIVPMYTMNLQEYPVLLDIIHLFRMGPSLTTLKSVHNGHRPCPDCKRGLTSIHQRIEITFSDATLSVRFSPRPQAVDAHSANGAHHQTDRSPIVMVITSLDLTIKLLQYEDVLSRIDWAVFTRLVLALPYLRGSRCVGLAFQGATADSAKFVREHGPALQPLIDTMVLDVKSI